MVVLPFVPHAVTTIPADQMRDEPRLSLEDTLGELLVFEPHRGCGERRIVPRLAVGEGLVVITNDGRGFLYDLIYASCRRIIELVTCAQQRGRRDVVADP